MPDIPNKTKRNRRQKRIRPKTLKHKKSTSKSTSHFDTGFSHLHIQGVPTIEGIYEWYKHLFEHLGWMILAKQRGYHDKLFEYKNSIQRLLEAIEHRSKMLHDKDIKKDFEILHDNLSVLKKHAEEDKLI